MFDSLINTLLVLGGALRLHLARAAGRGAAAMARPRWSEKQLGLPEAVAALRPGRLVCAQCLRSRSKRAAAVSQTRDLISSPALFSLAIIVILTALLQLRGFSVLSLGGFSRLGFGRIVSTAAVLLFAAYPLLFVADQISHWFLGEGSSRQQIVEMFTGSETLQQRVLIIVLAVAIAPMAEEFIFRFFLYGVCKRYLGRNAGLDPERAPFRRGARASAELSCRSSSSAACLTLAYEWSGSILVSMTMHALFNFLSLSALAFPNLLPQ